MLYRLSRHSKWKDKKCDSKLMILMKKAILRTLTGGFISHLSVKLEFKRKVDEERLSNESKVKRNI